MRTVARRRRPGATAFGWIRIWETGKALETMWRGSSAQVIHIRPLWAKERDMVPHDRVKIADHEITFKGWRR